MEKRKKLHTVLIIDDMADNIKILMEFLKHAYRILPATSGEKGIKLAASDDNRPDIILLDILMPGMDGYTVCKRLKNDERTKDIPIIFVTAVSEVMDATRGFKLGAVDYITKPFHPPVVKAKIETHLTLLEQKHELQQANATKDKLFSTIAHDMRNKFAALINTIDLMESFFDQMDEGEKKDALKNISDASKQMHKLFENLFTWAQTQTKTIDIQPAHIPLLETVTRTTDLFADEVNAKQLKLEIDIPPDAAVYCDEEMLSIILRNLVHNAIKYCDTNERVALAAHSRDGRQEIIVSDTGNGMSQEMCDTVFNLGSHRSTPGTREETGSGLGLLLVKEFVELNNGSVSIASRETIGTKVVVTLPEGA